MKMKEGIYKGMRNEAPVTPEPKDNPPRQKPRKIKIGKYADAPDDMFELHGGLKACTCHDCKQRDDCVWAYDWYNITDDCVAIK